MLLGPRRVAEVAAGRAGQDMACCLCPATLAVPWTLRPVPARPQGDQETGGDRHGADWHSYKVSPLHKPWLRRRPHTSGQPP